MSSELARPIPDKLSIWPAEVGAAVVAFIGDGRGSTPRRRV